MAQADNYLKIDGVTGESDDDTHPNEIVVESWSFGANQTGTSQSQVGKGGGGGRVVVRDLQITKIADSSSPTLMQACASHKHFATAVLTCRVQGENPLEYLVYNFTDVVISSFNQSGHGASGGGAKPHENVTLSFATFTMDYTPQLETGAGGPKVHAGWDIQANKAK